MLNFIRKQSIYSLYTTDVDGTSNFWTINYFKSTNNNWFNQKQSTWSPFNDKPTEILLEAAPHPLIDCPRSLFLEDFMLMDKGGKILFLVSKYHPLMKYNSLQSDRIQKKCLRRRKIKFLFPGVPVNPLKYGMMSHGAQYSFQQQCIYAPK